MDYVKLTSWIEAALQTPKIRDLSEHQVADRVQHYLNDYLATTGLKMAQGGETEENAIQATAILSADPLKLSCGNYHIGEVLIAMRLAAYKELGEGAFWCRTPSEVLGVVKAYALNPEVCRVKKEIRAALVAANEQKLLEAAKEEVEQHAPDWAVQLCREEYELRGYITGPFEEAFKYLLAQGVFPCHTKDGAKVPTAEFFKRCNELAKSELERQRSVLKVANNRNGARAITLALEDEKSMTLSNERKRQALKLYFDEKLTKTK